MYFQRAVAEAPQGARGYAGLAEVWGVLADDAPPGSHERAVRAEVARSNAEAALARDPESAEGHARPRDFRARRAQRARGPELGGVSPRRSSSTRATSTRGNGTRSSCFSAAASPPPRTSSSTRQPPYSRRTSRSHPGTRAYTTCCATATRLSRKYRASGARDQPSYAPAQLGSSCCRWSNAAATARRNWPSARSISTNYRHPTAIPRAAQPSHRPAHGPPYRSARTETRRLRSDERSHPLGDPDDDLVVAAFALDGQREEARRLRSHMQFAYDQWRRVIQLDPIVGPVYRQLGDSG